ncbi:MAG: response regulator [Gammaproteobacteria bacterium]|nr:response regulator [Gammaproteobacteria bacterium]
MDIQELSVILIEPSHMQQHLIQNYLQEFGISILDRFETGMQALQDIRRTPPDLVISSLYLADMTGTELLYAMRDDETLMETAFILISSETRVHYLDPIRQAGAIAILTKPFSKDDLYLALQSTLDFLEAPELELECIDTESLQVLVVDDSRLSRNHLRRILESMGVAQISEAENGRQGAKLINENYYDLVISDYNMPEMDGQELVDYVRNNSNQSGIPILMVTSESSQSRLAAVQKSGVSAVCDKPFEPIVLKQVLERILLET